MNFSPVAGRRAGVPGADRQLLGRNGRRRRRPGEHHHARRARASFTARRTSSSATTSWTRAPGMRCRARITCGRTISARRWADRSTARRRSSSPTTRASARRWRRPWSTPSRRRTKSAGRFQRQWRHDLQSFQLAAESGFQSEPARQSHQSADLCATLSRATSFPTTLLNSAAARMLQNYVPRAEQHGRYGHGDDDDGRPTVFGTGPGLQQLPGRAEHAAHQQPGNDPRGPRLRRRPTL